MTVFVSFRANLSRIDTKYKNFSARHHNVQIVPKNTVLPDVPVVLDQTVLSRSVSIVCEFCRILHRTSFVGLTQFASCFSLFVIARDCKHIDNDGSVVIAADITHNFTTQTSPSFVPRALLFKIYRFVGTSVVVFVLVIVAVVAVVHRLVVPLSIRRNGAGSGSRPPTTTTASATSATTTT